MHTEPYERRNICFNANKKEMISIMIFGTGNCSERVESILVNGKYELAGYLDNNPQKHYKILMVRPFLSLLTLMIRLLKKNVKSSYMLLLLQFLIFNTVLILKKLLLVVEFHKIPN